MSCSHVHYVCSDDDDDAGTDKIIMSDKRRRISHRRTQDFAMEEVHVVRVGEGVWGGRSLPEA